MVLHNLVNFFYPPTRIRQKSAVEVDKEEVGAQEEPLKFYGFSVNQILLSIGTDADIASDWAYWASIKDNPAVPSALKYAALFFVLVSSLLYILQVLEGRGFKSIFKKILRIELTKRKIAQWSVWFEDIPQVILTLLVTFSHSWSTLGIVNIVTSVVDAIQKTKALWEGTIEDDEEEEPVGEASPLVTA